MPVLAVDADLELPGSPGLQDCIHSVVDDVQEDLLDLVGIGNHRRQFARRFPLHADVIDLQIVVAQRQRLVEHLPQIDFIPLRLPLPRE